ncbi:hypothetical protein RJ639_010595 [Escallonia herrerae]|uniref:VQ domain-containing protein n=1 Tax=Escallonia herrerae TaxID=1293975 RepID=A0AA89ATA6_9ASTE|nr:hypothetical protein RJ639_010595 [Escallonia herrerae]
MEFGKDRKSNPISRADGKAPLKVKYISSPIHVSARDACEFKTVVQQLTGQKSEVPSPTCARMMGTTELASFMTTKGLQEQNLQLYSRVAVTSSPAPRHCASSVKISLGEKLQKPYSTSNFHAIYKSPPVWLHGKILTNYLE